MSDVSTIIGIRAESSGCNSSDSSSVKDENLELYEIIRLIEAAGERLDDLILRYDARDEDTTELDKAADALSDAADSLDAVLDEY